jgi:hypothetical protein
MEEVKTPEQMAEEYIRYDNESVYWTKHAFLAGYQAAKDEEVTKDQQIAALWTESIKNMLPSVHEVVLFPSESTRARDAEVVAKMDAAIKKAKDQLADSDKVMPQWISVKDRLPEEGQDVLVWYHRSYNVAYLQKMKPVKLQPPQFNNVEMFEWCFDDFEDFDVTYWHPLPAPPKEEK